MLYCNAGRGWQTDPSDGCRIKAKAWILNYCDLEVNSMFCQVLVSSLYSCLLMSKKKTRIMKGWKWNCCILGDFPSLQLQWWTHVLMFIVFSNISRNLEKVVPTCTHSSSREQMWVTVWPFFSECLWWHVSCMIHLENKFQLFVSAELLNWQFNSPLHLLFW
jgi:hypothetical protein